MATPDLRWAVVLAILFAASPGFCGPVGPALEFDFDEGTGTTLVNTGTLGAGSNATVSGIQFSTDSAFATGFSVQFDGDPDFVEIPDSFDYGQALTVDMWIKPASVVGQTALYDDYGNPGVLMAVVDGLLEWGLSTSAHPGLGIAIFDGELCADLWQHVSGTYDGATMRAWINGVEVGTVTTSGSITDNGSNATHIGADSFDPAQLGFNGKIDGFRLFHAAVPPEKPLLLCGELSGDCEISTVDALTALRMSVALIPAEDAADVDASDVVSASDALAILRIAVGINEQSNRCNRL